MPVHVDYGSVQDIKTGIQGHLAVTMKLHHHSEARVGLWQEWTSNVACSSRRGHDMQQKSSGLQPDFVLYGGRAASHTAHAYTTRSP